MTEREIAENHVEVFGQDVGVGARVPPLTLSGPAQIAQLGNAEFDLTTVQVWGPIRPRLSIGPLKRPADNGPVLGPHTVDGAGDAVRDLGEGFVTWYLWGAAGIVLVALSPDTTTRIGSAVFTGSELAADVSSPEQPANPTVTANPRASTY